MWEKQADEATERGGDTGRESRGFMNGASQVEPLGRGKSMMTNVWKRNVSLHSHEGPRQVPEQHTLVEKRFEKKTQRKEEFNCNTKQSIVIIQNNKKIKKEEADAFNHSLQKAKSAEKNTKFEF